MRALGRLAIVGGLLLAAGCGARDLSTDEPRTPVIVVGIDGADWGVIRELWDRGELPNLRRLAEEGVSGPLKTAYGKSPVIWTTIATGRRPPEHGITDFVVPGPEGDVPVSSTVRTVPALWNMASAAGLRAAVLGWWASWPAEAIEGVVISDRALIEERDPVSPPDFAGRFERLRDEALSEETGFGGNPAARNRDQLMARAARELADEGFDLLMVYFRGVDIASHFTWKAWEPSEFPDPDPEWVEAHADDIPAVYRATDRAIGELLAAAPPSNVFVVSDHGFHAVREETRVVLDLDRVLEDLGFLSRAPTGGIDRNLSLAWSHRSPPTRAVKLLALGPDHSVADRTALVSRLEGVRYESGRAALRVRDPRPGEAKQGAELVVKVLSEGASRRLSTAEGPLSAAISDIHRISGSHGAHTAGIFLARGPDLDPSADPEEIRIHDLAPTLLYALGLPVGDDMAGEARTELFHHEFRRENPLRTIPTWGSGGGEVTESAMDEELMEELRSLGYL